MGETLLAQKKGWLPWRFDLSIVMWFDGEGDAVHSPPEQTNGKVAALECLVWAQAGLW
jgi:hypothetical protein